MSAELRQVIREVAESTDPDSVFESPVWRWNGFAVTRVTGRRFVCVYCEDDFDTADAAAELARAGLRFSWDGKASRFLVPDEVTP